MAIIDKIQTIVLLMFENRSFDHMLGHLSLELGRKDIDGLSKALDKYNNLYKGNSYPVFKMRGDTDFLLDLPHELEPVKMQLGKHPVNGRYTMKGFVEAYSHVENAVVNHECEPMGYYVSKDVPITSFLAQTFCTCDRWFSPLPTSTQPNRNMAFCGFTPIKDTYSRPIDINHSLFDWMDDNHIRWNVYHDGLTFFAMYPHLWKYVLDTRFKDYEEMFADMQKPVASNDPQVIIVEPSYYSSPHIGSDRPNDNHTPLAIGWGEEFLRRTYQAVIANAERWGNTLMVVYYDEHGGFFDHVPPPKIPYETTANPSFKFESLGVRVPGILVSPYVNQGSACHELLDHTSVLQFLAEKFTPGSPYSQIVEARRNQGINSLSVALTNEVEQVPDAPFPPSQPINVKTALGKTVQTGPQEPISKSFENAALELLKEKPEQMREKYPELLLWKNARDNS
jgi:phospholipase C